MGPEEHVDVEALAHAAADALNGGDLEGFLALVHPEAEFTSMIAEMEGERVEGDRGVARLRIAGTLGGVEVSQAMWQAFRAREAVGIAG